MLDKTYQPAAMEGRRYALWERSGAFGANPDSDKPPYAIMMPPPNVTGSLHMGHALTFTLQDILIRFERMRGRDALWQPGTDHAGIATEIVVSNRLAERQINKHDIGRDKFIERELGALQNRLAQPDLTEADQMAVLQERQRLRELKQTPPFASS